MGKPLVIATFFFIGGLVIGSRRPFPWPALLIPLPGAAWYFLRRRGEVSRWLPLLCLVFFSAGWARYAAALRTRPDHIIRLEPGRTLEVTGTVAGEPVFKRHSAEFVLRSRRAREKGGEPRPASGPLLVRFHGAPADIRPVVVPGRSVRVAGRLHRPEERGNPGEVSQRERLGARGIYRLLRVYGSEGIAAAGEGSARSWREWPSALRRRLNSSLLASYCPDSSPTLSSLFLGAVLLGERGELPARLREAFRESGLAHLLAISGLHVGFIWLLGGLIFSPLPLRTRHALLLVLIAAYVYITGARPPAVRAGIMAGIFSLAYVLNQPRDLWAALAAAALLILLADPFSIFRMDFQFSFLIVAAIISLAPILSRALVFLPARLRPWAAVPLAAQIGAIPLTAHYFHRFHPVAIPANMMAVPLTAAIVNLGFVSSLLGMAWAPLGTLAGYPNRFLIALLVRLTEYFSAARPAALSILYLPGLRAAAFLAAIFWLGAAVRRFRPGLLLVLPVLLAASAAPLSGRRAPLELVFFNGPSGDFTLAFLPGGEVILAAPDDDGFGEVPSLVAPYLRRRGKGKIDYLILTRAGLNRLDTLARLREGFRVGMILDHPAGESSPTHRLLVELAEREGIPLREAAAGERIRLGRAEISFLWPHAGAGFDEEPSSPVIRLDYGRIGVLLTERLDPSTQLKLLELGGRLPSTILKAPMKGSRAHFRPEFAAAVRPEAAVLVQGREYFGRHPAHCGPELSELGAEVYLTSRDGALILESDGKNWRIRKGVEEEAARWRFAQ